MADPVADIEIQLKRAVTLATANDQRAQLNQDFDRLNSDQAAALLERILTLDGSRLPHDFRRLHRAVRLELLLKIAMRLGNQTSDSFHTRLTARAGDAKLQKGLQYVFPEGMPALRDKFLKALQHGPPRGIPTVRLEFRSHGEKPSEDSDLKSLLPETLGLDPNPGSGLNWMEIRGTVIGHRPDAEYRFDRTIEMAKWYLVGSTWKAQVYAPPGTNDNKHSGDKDTHPDNDHIYVTDSPGFTEIPPLLYSMPSADQSKVTEYVFMMNAIETVDVRIGKGAWSRAAQLEWFSVTWLEIASGKWRRKPGKNKILKGSIDDLGVAASTGAPPESF